MFDLLTPEPAVARKDLRPHQERAIEMLRASCKSGRKRPILSAPTGFGKTLVSARIIEGAMEKGSRVAFCVPAISLIDQTVEAFSAEGLRDVGVVQAAHRMTDYSQPIQICSVQTLARRPMQSFDLVLVDECHLQFEAVLRWMKACPKTTFLGLSATPWSAGLGKHYDDLLIAATTRELIDAGYLSDYSIYAPSSPDLSGVKITAGEYQADQLSAVMRDHKLVGDVVESWLRLGNNDPTLCFAVDRAHAKALQKRFESAGVAFGYCDAKTDVIERKVLFQKMKRREIAGICNVGTLTTGVDADVRTLVLARPTKSPSLFVQIIGRALRTAPGKAEATIIDHSDTTLRLGMPCSIVRTSLCNGKKAAAGKRQEQVRLPKACTKCGAVKEPSVLACQKCGFEPENVRDVEAATGELIALRGRPREITRQEKQEWYSALLWIASERGYKPGWASNQYRQRHSVWPNGLEESPREPSPAIRSWVKSRQIAYAKARKPA